jgi:hypothetical protein
MGLCLLLTRCGGAARQPPSSPAQDHGPEERERSTTDSAAPPAAAAPPNTAPPMGQPAVGGARAVALGELERSEHELKASPGDCATACRALASMERAAAQICSLTGESGDAAQCDDARRRLLSARDRVRSACGGCPAGPSVDHDAPIPSTR